MLFPDSEKFMTQEEFLGCCETSLSKEDFKTLQSASLLPKVNSGKNSVLADWSNWEISLRSELVKLRALKKGLDSDKYIQGNLGEGSVFELARDAFNSPNPLEAEILLNSGRWDYLEMLESNHFFDLDRLIIYYLKLQILERKSLINHEKGQNDFKVLYSALLEKDGAD